MQQLFFTDSFDADVIYLEKVTCTQIRREIAYSLTYKAMFYNVR